MPNQAKLPVLHDNTIPYFDGMRGVAILLVALGHYFSEIYIFKIGWVGLNLFFVLSGFLITRSLFDIRDFSAAGYFRSFYMKRILRIFPLYYGILLIFFVLIPILSQSIGSYFSELDKIQGSYWFYTSNWNIIQDGLPQQPIFFHFWSLAVEEQFYLVWPVIFLLCQTSKSKYIVIAVSLALSFSSRILTGDVLHAYLSSFTAAEPLLLGCLLSLLHKDSILPRLIRPLRAGAMLSIALLCFIFINDPDLHITNIWLMKYGYSAINIIIVAIFAFLLTASAGAAVLQDLFSRGWLRWLGKYSYSIYVFHWIVLQTLVFKIESILLAAEVTSVASYWMARLTGIILTLFISYYSYQYFESRFLLLKKHFSTDVSRRWSLRRIFTFAGDAKPVRH